MNIDEIDDPLECADLLAEKVLGWPGGVMWGYIELLAKRYQELRKK
jgi:hypothetical protein